MPFTCAQVCLSPQPRHLPPVSELLTPLSEDLMNRMDEHRLRPAELLRCLCPTPTPPSLCPLRPQGILGVMADRYVQEAAQQ